MDPNEKLILYIDNSNIFINTQKYSATKKGYLGGVQDWCCRIDIGRLLSEACGGRELIHGKLYGSEPPLLDSVWKKIREQKIEVFHSKRYSRNSKEKQTDTSLSVAATEDLIMKRDLAGPERTMILFTGDRDMLDIVHVAIRFQWNVEIWSYKHCLARELLNEQKSHQVKVIYIDDYFDKITFSEVIWGRPIPPERSLVFKFPDPLIDDPGKKRLKYVISACSDLFQIPFMGKFIADYDTDVVLIPCISEYGRKGSEKAVRLQEFISEIGQGHNIPTEETDHLYDCITKVNEDSNRYTQQKDQLATFVKQITDRELINQDQSKVLTDLIEQIAKSGKPDESHKLYDFNTHIWNRIKELKEIKLKDYKNCEIQTFFEYRSKQTDNSFYVHSLDEIGNDQGNMYDAAAAEVFITVGRKYTRPSALYSESCKYDFTCKSGKKCHYNHSKKEKEFFAEHPRINRTLYKSRPCSYLDRCKYKVNTHLCPFAHAAPGGNRLIEARCVRCKAIGIHWTDECPLNANQ